MSNTSYTDFDDVSIGPKLLYNFPDVKINSNSKIEITEYVDEYHVPKGCYFEINLIINDKKRFLGRFRDFEYRVDAGYKDGKILIFEEKFNDMSKTMKIEKVFSLYEILDNTFYSCTEKEAIKLFDNSLDDSCLKNPNNMIYRSDIEKIKRQKAF